LYFYVYEILKSLTKATQ